MTDRYQWISAYILDAMTTTALDHHDQARAERLVDALAALAARGGMRELVVRAHLHRGRRATDPLGHEIVTDMPPEVGGADTGPTPGTVLRAAIGTCAVTRRQVPLTVQVDLA